MSKPQMTKEIPKPGSGSMEASILSMLCGATVSMTDTQSTFAEREAGEKTVAGARASEPADRINREVSARAPDCATPAARTSQRDVPASRKDGATRLPANRKTN